jgi:hypothetical protein
MQKAVGSSAVCGFPIALAGSLSYMFIGMDNSFLPNYSLGYVYIPAACVIGITSMVTAPIGAKIAIGLKQTVLRKAFSILIIIMAINLLLR